MKKQTLSQIVRESLSNIVKTLNYKNPKKTPEMPEQEIFKDGFPGGDDVEVGAIVTACSCPEHVLCVLACIAENHCINGDVIEIVGLACKVYGLLGRCCPV